jgi:hypothetical protein
MAYLAVPTEFAVGLGRNCQNGQAADASPVEAIERAIAHLLGYRRFSIPLICQPRTYTASATLNARVRVQSWTASGMLRLVYATQTPYDYWTLTVSSSLGSASVTLRPSPAGLTSVDGADEGALSFELGNTTAAAVADLDLTITLAFARTDPLVAALSSPQDLRLFSMSLSVNPVPTIED